MSTLESDMDYPPSRPIRATRILESSVLAKIEPTKDFLRSPKPWNVEQRVDKSKSAAWHTY